MTPPPPPPPAPALDPRECFERHRALAFRWARAHGLHDTDAADCVQQAFTSLVQHRPTFLNAAVQLAWLRRVTSNAAIDVLRRRRRAPLAPIARQPDDQPAAPDAHAIPDDQRAALADAMLAISDQQRLVLLAKAVEGLTFAQISLHLGVAEPTAKTHYRRALDAVRAAMPDLSAPPRPHQRPIPPPLALTAAAPSKERAP